MSHAIKNRNNNADGNDISSSGECTESDDPDGNSRQDTPVDRVANQPGEPSVLHETRCKGRGERIKEYLRGSGIVYRAMGLLEEWKYLTARISSAKIPVDIIALRKDVVLLIQVISSRKPLPDAKTILRHYAEKIGNLRSMGTSMQFRKMLLAYSRSCGWKFFEVLPSGLIPAWTVPAVPDS